jgi:asparagine synthase (glutamine-hydrolysing)
VCGIVGIYHRDGRPIDAAVLARMTEALAHRGPDDSGIWTEAGTGFGHRRLSIRDLSPTGAQPFHSACGRIVVTYNGEIYNDDALARDLARDGGFVRRTRCDTEILPAGWMAWGTGLFERLEGIYALAIWDRETQELVLARDGIGVKPLYVADDGVTVRFGSEVKALISDHDLRTRIAPAAVAELLAAGHVAPVRSMLADVTQLAPGTVRVIGAGGVKDHRFWKPARRAQIRSMADARDAFVGLFRQVVSDQLISDVPVAVLQSGGIDSSLISLVLPDHADVGLYNVRFRQAAFDESKSAAELAAAAGRSVTFLDLDTSDAAQDFQAVVRAVDGGLADSSALATYRLSRRVRAAAKVALSGDGSDEFFGGYPTYRASAAAPWLRRLLPSPAWSGLAHLLAGIGGFSGSRVGRAETLARMCFGLSLTVPHSGWRTYLYPWDRDLVYGPELRRLGDHNPLATYAGAFSGAKGDDWNKGLLADENHYLPADMLMKLDRTSMAHGLEVRVPFVDRRIMEFAGQLDRKLLATMNGQTKRVLREAARQLGAPPTVTQASKRGFNVPMNDLLAEGLRPLADRMLDKEADILTPYCAADGVRRIWRDHRDGKTDRRFAIWSLLTLAVWREQTGL